ncbi:MAG: crossover junction endodeoxyribonuclease RuvC [Gemmatimonas sp.]|uniref:crossover junction endodeoxyribonuclease RuvC n=1 Tax=Gemmatimonas sp. TaxID=1962908 RepID=UPI00391F44B9|nr:crossover junction endodeoxyribonuclease RuvC [Gemmatimonadota bacterium]
MTRPSLVLGIDPGTAVTGFGVVAFDGRTPTLMECGVIRTTARDPLPLRLAEVHEGVRELIGRHRPDTLAIEDVFYARNVRTTVVLGHARGVILLAAQLAALTIHEYPPAEIKKAITGKGGATKEQVQFMVARLLRLRSAPQPADASDGVAAALCACLSSTLPRLRDLKLPMMKTVKTTSTLRRR